MPHTPPAVHDHLSTRRNSGGRRRYTGSGLGITHTCGESRRGTRRGKVNRAPRSASGVDRHRVARTPNEAGNRSRICPARAREGTMEQQTWWAQTLVGLGGGWSPDVYGLHSVQASVRRRGGRSAGARDWCSSVPDPRGAAPHRAGRARSRQRRRRDRRAAQAGGDVRALNASGRTCTAHSTSSGTGSTSTSRRRETPRRRSDSSARR